MKAYYVKLLSALSLFLTFSYGLFSQVPAPFADSLQAILNRSLPPGVSNPGAVLTVTVPGQWSWSGASGNAISGMTNGHPATLATPNTHFRAGSISKTLLAAAILKLEEAGALSITDSIGKYLRSTLVIDTIQSSGTVTIERCLNHTSGIGNSADNQQCQQNVLSNLTAPVTLEEAIYCGGSTGEFFPPGFAWAYSNTNYSILAMIIEEVSGMKSTDYITQNIITPLGLQNTYYPTTDELQDEHMGCYWNIGQWVDMTIVDPTVYWGWADLVSTTSDLNTFYQALRNGQVVSQASLTKMMTIDPVSFDYGLGLDFYTVGAHSYYGHSGEVGNSSGMFYSALSNANCPNGYYISYNYNYQGVSLFTVIDEPVYNLLSSLFVGLHPAETFTGGFTIAPNPAKDMLFIYGNEKQNGPLAVEILDINGRLCEKYQVNTCMGNASISLTGLQSGVYSVVLKQANGVQMKKLVIQE